MNHEMIPRTCSFKYKQATSYQPLPPIFHQSICEGTENFHSLHCLKNNLKLNLGRIFTKFRTNRVRQREKNGDKSCFIREIEYPCFLKRRQKESSATSVFYPLGVLQHPCNQIDISEPWEAICWGDWGLRFPTPLNTVCSTSIQRLQIAERRAGSLGVGKRERDGMGNFRGLRSQGQCFDKKEEQRNLHSGTWWGFAILIYSISWTHQRARNREVRENLP